MNDKPLSPAHCHGCGAITTDGVVAEYDGGPFARLRAACTCTVAGRYAFLGAVFTGSGRGERAHGSAPYTDYRDHSRGPGITPP